MALKLLLVTVFLLAISSSYHLYGQIPRTIDGKQMLPIRVVNGDTLPNINLRQVVVFPDRKFSNKRDYRRYRRLIRNLKVVYPYVQVAKYKISEMDAHYRTLDSDAAKRAYVKQVEKELREEFEGQLVKLTFSQGRLLIKLIDREIGRTSYAVIRDLRGGFSAVFWQAVARVFGSNLKAEFDAYGDDMLLNELIILHEHGLL
ncbi:MAG: DUF4294 domain-containing protein [Bacteroidales bacterium]